MSDCGTMWITGALFGSGLCQRLRDVSQQWSVCVESHGGLRPIKKRITQMEPLVQHAHCQPLAAVPPVVQFDGTWLTRVELQETVTTEKRGRRRTMCQGTHVVVVALGFWPDGRRTVLDGDIARREEHPHWQKR
jgi:hypothetical protein